MSAAPVCDGDRRAPALARSVAAQQLRGPAVRPATGHGRQAPRSGHRVTATAHRQAHAPATGRAHRAAARSPVSTLLLLVVALLCVIGLVMVGSASSVVSIATYGTPVGDPDQGGHVDGDRRRRALAGRRASTTAGCAASVPLLVLVTFGLLFVVLVPGSGVHAKGSSRWVGFGQFRLQPSELMKLALTLFAADFIARRLDEDATDRRIIGPLILVTGFACVLILAQPDMGTAMVLGCIALALLFVSGVRLGPVMKVMAALVGAGPDRGGGLALPPGPAAVVHRSRRPTARARATRSSSR